MSVATGNITAIKKGLMLCIDPSSGSRGSHIGYAVYHAGKLVEAGHIDMSDDWDKEVSHRLKALGDELRDKFTAEFDLLVVEQIRSINRGRDYRATHQLVWAVGCLLSNLRYKKKVELHTRTWQGIVNRTWTAYTKSDMNDAIGIGVGMIALAWGYYPKKINNKSQQDLLESTIKPKIREALT